MSDLISRQEAIDIVSGYAERFNGYIGSPNDSEVYAYARGLLLSIGMDINAVPSAQSEQRWIPVTERLPEIDMSYPHHEDYLVQYDSGNMDVASWSNVNRFWTDHVTEPHWNCVQFAEVIAWMPLPEPYKGERKDDAV